MLRSILAARPARAAILAAVCVAAASLAAGQTVTFTLSGTYSSLPGNSQAPWIIPGANWTLSMTFKNPPPLLNPDPSSFETSFQSATYTVNGNVVPLTNNDLVFNASAVDVPMTILLDSKTALIVNGVFQFYSGPGTSPLFVPGTYTSSGISSEVNFNFFSAAAGNPQIVVTGGSSPPAPPATAPLPASGWLTLLGLGALGWWAKARGIFRNPLRPA